MTQRGQPTSKPEDQSGDDFQRITGIGEKYERRLHEAGILTYQDLGALSPEEIAAVVGISAERIGRQDWAGQARQRAGPPAAPPPSEPSQHYASFHIELLLDVDDSVRRTKVRHLQSDTDEAWPGWDEGRLLALLRSHIPRPVSRRPAEAIDVQSSGAPPPSRPEMVASSGAEPATGSPSGSLPSSLRIEELSPIHEGEGTYAWAPGEPASVRLTMRVNRTKLLRADVLDFTAEVIARNKLGDHQRWPLGTVQGTIRVGEPLTVELTGPSLRRGLYRLEATVDIYPADHAPESEPLHSQRTSGQLIQVADAPTPSAQRGMTAL